MRKTRIERMDGLGEVREIQLRNESFKGKIMGLDESGTLMMESEDGIRHRLTVADYFGTREG